ncbi:MAG: substrate-binding domain-containing protein [Veillonellaceae bacterium]|nr:substrate-binding domain-containing protein [Veillonellaceae bacterium]
MKTKQRLGMAASALLLVLAMAGCGGGAGTSNDAAWKPESEIHVISRESGSGTRGAFIELVGIEVKEDGKKVDHTYDKAQITNSTHVMLTSVANDPYAIGYISLGSLNDTVKALDVDGVKATAENVMNSTYPLARPFHVVMRKGQELSPAAADFMRFIHSAEGQKLVNDNGFVAVETSPAAYTPANTSGTLVVAGSSSISPLMEKLAEAYRVHNPDLKIEVQMSDSTTGVQAAITQTAELGMASRDLKDSEKAEADADVIARDGLAVVVNPKNPLGGINRDSLKNVFIGQLKKWNELK